MECKKPRNLEFCTCTAGCGTKGICCDCLQKHLSRQQLPGCCFPADAEKTYDRSFAAFAQAWGLKG